MNRRQTSRTPGPPHRLFSSFLPAFLINPIRPQNPYKTRTNPYKKHECKFSRCSATTTYNFNTVKCTDFSTRRPSPLPRGEGKGEGQTGSCLFVSIRGLNRKLTKTDRFQPKLPGAYCTTTSELNKTERKCQTPLINHASRVERLRIGRCGRRIPSALKQPIDTGPLSPLPRGEGQGEGQTGSLLRAPGRSPQRMRDRPVLRVRWRKIQTKLRQNADKIANVNFLLT